MESTRRGRVLVALMLIVIGLIFLMANIGFYSLDTVGEVAGQAGRAIGEFFGGLGRDFGRSVSSLWPLLLIALGLFLVFHHPSQKRKHALND